MRQIDLMVTAKKAEWENHTHAFQIQLDKKTKELEFVKDQLDQKSQEVGVLQQKAEEMELTQRDLVEEYEEHVINLKEEVDRLKHEHDKLKKKSSKQTIQVEKERDQLLVDLKSRNSEVDKLKDKIEEFRTKMSELEIGRKARDDRIRGLENQKKALIEKCDLMQQQSLGYQAQLNKRRQMMENLERDHQQEMAQLHSQLDRAKDDCDGTEDTVQQLKSSLEEALSSNREQASDIANLQDELRRIHSSFQRLEEENEHLQMELQAAAEDQRQHSEDMSKLEENLILKDEAIRQLKDGGRRTESIEIKRLKEDLRTSRLEIQSHLDTSQYQKNEVSHLTKRLEQSKNEISKLQAELTRKDEEVKFIEENNVKQLALENSKLKERISTEDDGHQAEKEGMKQQITGMTAELHKRDTAMASISERAQRMEKDLREATTRLDRTTAELQVTNAQLEALRIENRHLRDTALNDQLTDLSDLHGGNLQLVRELEDDNRNLRTEVTTLREELTTLEGKYQDKYRNALRNNQDVLADIKDNEFRRHSELRSESDHKISSLEGTIKRYESQLHRLQTENERLRSIETSAGHRGSGVPQPLLSSTSKELPEYVPRRTVDASQTSSASGYTDTEALTHADITMGPPHSDSEIFVTTPVRPARRSSFTSDYLAEETFREGSRFKRIDNHFGWFALMEAEVEDDEDDDDSMDNETTEADEQKPTLLGTARIIRKVLSL
ncbi:PREDICTED: centrosomal protein of 63 kDa-like [Acropora digitifera]|uniref:centrosomal protein of 63 kDa-like n=1 Tax=Acropora digitifera TaxID=70779 RepID=UPI00077ACB5C|nr:PREDICTED: centrosomal protein of 63 kDa-like [Acropora digitifera]